VGDSNYPPAGMSYFAELAARYLIARGYVVRVVETEKAVDKYVSEHVDKVERALEEKREECLRWEKRFRLLEKALARAEARISESEEGKGAA